MNFVPPPTAAFGQFAAWAILVLALIFLFAVLWTGGELATRRWMPGIMGIMGLILGGYLIYQSATVVTGLSGLQALVGVGGLALGGG